MSFTLSDLLGVENPTDDIVNSNGTVNLGAAEDWIRENIDAVDELFGSGGAALHVGQSRSGVVGIFNNIGLEGGGEITVGVGGGISRGFFGQPSLELGVTASAAIIAGVDYSRGSFDLEIENDRLLETGVIFGRVDDLQGGAAGIEFTMTVNGIKGGFGAVVPIDEVGDVIASINQRLSGSNFSTSGNGRQAIADTLADIFPPGSMLIGLGGQSISTNVGGGATLMFELIGTGVASNQDEAVQALREFILNEVLVLRQECFLSNTMIPILSLTEKNYLARKPSGSITEFLSALKRKPISEIKTGDYVLSYDKNGCLQAGKVSRTFENTVNHILDFWGFGVTPGHAFFCADGELKGLHVPILDILRTDGAVLDEEGNLIRAATGCRVGSEGDSFVKVICGDKLPNGRFKVRECGQIRSGTRIILGDGRDLSVLDLVASNHGEITESGLVKGVEGLEMPFLWHFSQNLPLPEDYILKRSKLTVEEVYRAGEWEQIKTRLSAPPDRQLGSRDKLRPNVPPAFEGHPDAPMVSANFKAH